MPSPNLIDPARLPAGGPAGLTNQPYRVGEDHTDSDGSVEKVSPGSTAITGRRNQPAPTRRTAMFLKKKKKKLDGLPIAPEQNSDRVAPNKRQTVAAHEF
jgi:hypothetical protein